VNHIRRTIGRAARRVPGLRGWAARLDHYRRVEREHHELLGRIRFPPGHFYSPHPDPAEYAACPDTMAEPPLDPARLRGLDLNGAEQFATLQSLTPFYDEQPFGEHPAPGLRYHFDNIFFTHADALSLYGLMRLGRPRQIIEVGSGFSSCVMLDTNERFLNGECRLTFIEPYPDDRLAGLTAGVDRSRFDLVQSKVQNLDPALFERLRAGDMLFIDSSHVAKAGSDVNFLVFEVLPRLAPGVLVHFHDIWYPFEYPRNLLDDGRAWNETYLIRAFLTFNPAFRIALFNAYLTRFHRQYFAEAMPLYLKNRGGSLWLRRV
jgi:predicted O-methyltransferase YrrM